MTRPWRILDQTRTDEGLLELRQRGERDFLITIDGRVLMNASANISEIALAHLACAPIKHVREPRVLVSGLGMGFTLKATLDQLPPQAAVVVAELNPVIVAWCRGPMVGLTDGAVDDPRVTLVIDDVAVVISAAAKKDAGRPFDAIILDLYEGPYKGWEYLFGAAALETSRAALTPDGVLAVWSEVPDPAFEKRLRAARFSVKRHRPGRGGRHAVYVAKRSL